MNSVNLVGRLTKDVELRYTPNGTPTASFSIAIDRSFKNAQGETETDFINIVVWRKLAELVSQYLSKGKLCSVEGRLQTRRYEAKDGITRYITEVVADNVRFLSPKGVTYNNNVATTTESNEDDLPF